jgi:glycosyltransferase involved in cell wall biosynthesis
MKPRAVIVSHACVLDTNRSPYRTLAASTDCTLVVPAHWRHAFAPMPFPASDTPFPGDVVAVPVLGAGRPQRYLPRRWPGRLLRRVGATVVLIEEEAFSLSGLWWSWSARRHSIPYAIQIAENLDRRFPWPVRWWCRSVLAHAGLVMARSPQAARQAEQWGARGTVQVVPHGVDHVVASPRERRGTRVGFVGRLVGEKGVGDVLALAEAHPEWTVGVAGDGPLRSDVVNATPNVTWLGALPAAEMSSFYDNVDVVVVPSRSTPTWTEQFGRVIIEALANGVPVVAYDSGEIPWVASVTGALLVPEGDVAALATAVHDLFADDDAWRRAAEQGRDAVAAHFTNERAGQQLAAWVGDVSRGEVPRARRRVR